MARARTLPQKVFCQSGLYWQTFCNYNNLGTVSSFMTAKQNLASAVSQTPSDRNEGPTIFLDPQAVCNSVSGDPKELLNEAMLFHESLHGYYGLIDPILQSDFGLDEARPSVNITYYLDQNVLGGRLFYLHDEPTDPEPMQCPK
jgi:hypothetical protein